MGKYVIQKTNVFGKDLHEYITRYIQLHKCQINENLQNSKFWYIK